MRILVKIRGDEVTLGRLNNKTGLVEVSEDGNQYLGDDIDDPNGEGMEELIMEVCWICHADHSSPGDEKVPYHFYEIG